MKCAFKNALIVAGKVLGYGILTVFGLIALKFVFHFVFYIALIVLGIFNMGGETELVYQYEFEIEAIQDNHTYVMRRHSGESDLKYYFMRYRNDGLKSGYTSASNSTIIEDGDSKVVVYYEKPVRFQRTHDFFARMADPTDGDGSDMYYKHYEYHVPENSVKMEFNVDLE